MQVTDLADGRLNRLLAPHTQGYSSVWLSIEGRTVHCLVSGDAGPPLVLLHGDFGSWCHWVLNLQSLKHRYRVIVPDMPGYGDSDAPTEPFSERLAADAIVAVVRQLIASEPFRLTGFSLGGIIAGHVAAALASQVSHLALCVPGGLGLPQRLPRPVLETSLSDAPEDESIAIQRRNLTKLMLVDPEVANDFAARVHIANVAGTRVKATHLPRTDSLRTILPAVKAKVGAIWGRDDHYCDEAGIRLSEERLRECQPQLRFRLIEQAGHWVPFERPEKFAQALFELL